MIKDQFITAFDAQYESYHAIHKDLDMSKDSNVYYLRQELQALTDMWRSTQASKYLSQAKDLVFKAISDGIHNSATLYNGTESRGTWPCFSASRIPVHSQLNDFQGAAGFMLVARALQEANDSSYKTIATFVEEIIGKWLLRDAAINISLLSGSNSFFYLLSRLDTGRDKREHFATLCLDLAQLGYTKYPYRYWAISLIDLYLGVRESLKASPRFSGLGACSPADWGVLSRGTGYVWYWTVDGVQTVQDTSHANRTVWLAAEAYRDNLIDSKRMAGFIATFKNQIWSTDKTFYFKNYIDGTDASVGLLGPGRCGNVWFGWHRLAYLDSELDSLFIRLAESVADGGGAILPAGAQNYTMPEARLCLLAWAARLIG